MFSEGLTPLLRRWRPASDLRPAALWHLRTGGEETPSQSDGERSVILYILSLMTKMNSFPVGTGKSIHLAVSEASLAECISA